MEDMVVTVVVMFDFKNCCILHMHFAIANIFINSIVHLALLTRTPHSVYYVLG